MIGLMALAASIQQPSVSVLRAQVAEVGWRQCVVMIAKEIEKGMPTDSLEALDNEGKLSVAKEMCLPMAEDYRRALPDRVRILAREKGLNKSGEDALVDLLVDDVFKAVEESISLNWDGSG